MHKQCVCVYSICFQHLYAECRTATEGIEKMIHPRTPVVYVCIEVYDSHLRVLEKSVFLNAFDEH